MVLLTVRGIGVEFPYQPYEIQLNYMEKVIEALQTKANGLLESPTGTGKTLCLLCASLAWLENHKKLYPATTFQANQNSMDFSKDERKGRRDQARSTETPRIIYASRTHSQLAQVMQELKKTAYCKTKVAVLGSRDQMCINGDVTRLPSNAAKNRACRDKVKARSCSFFNNLDEKMDQLSLEPVADIEEIVGYGKRNRVCPFYLSKSNEKQADVIFMPYNYIFDPSVRRTMKLDLNNAVVILDEGHNVGKVCEESYSYELTSMDLAVSIREINRILNHMVKRGDLKGQPVDTHQAGSQVASGMESGEAPRASAVEVAELKRALLDFEKAYDAVPLPDNPDSGEVKPLAFLAQLFNTAGISQEKYGMLFLTLDNLTRESAEKDEQASVSSTMVAPIQKFMDLLGMAFAEEARKHHQFFRVYMRNEDVRKKAREGWNTDGVTTKHSRILNVWCLSPGCTMKTIASSGVHSIIITSGTLSPVEPLLKELMIPFKVQLCNPHIIKNSQVWVGVVGKGPDNVEWSSAYKNRESIEYRRSLGRGIVNFLDVIPDGVLIFFSSYRAMQDCVETWRSTELWDDMNKRKFCFVEPTNRTEFTTALADYFRIVKEEGKGAAFFGVCRGKISEGVDFPDVCARAVMITGLPYPAKMEPRIRVKMEYLDQSYRDPATKTLTSNEWYNREAWSAVNQSLGRVIRHASDFGACVLCDGRFGFEGNKKQLSGWLRNSTRDYPTPVAKRSLAEFFRGHASTPRPVASISLPPKSSDSNLLDRAKRELSPDQYPINCKSTCSSANRRCELAGDNDMLNLYSSQPNRPTALHPVHKSVFELKNGGLSKTSVFDTIDQNSARTLVSEFSNVEADRKPDRQFIPRVKADAIEVTDDEPMLISSTFTSYKAHKKLHVKPRSFHLDREEVTNASGSQIPGVPTGFVKVINRQPSTADLAVSSLSEKKPAGPTGAEAKKTPIAEAVGVLKRELTQGEYQHISKILGELKKEETLNCSRLTSALEAFVDRTKSHRISLLLSSFIPRKFRQEYDNYLTHNRIVFVID